jgi:hypothetical protein
MRKKCVGIVCLVLIVSVIGCGREFVPVEGNVTYEGKPLDRAIVTFIPETTGQPAHAITDREGYFRLSTFKPGSGARPGKYKVTVTMVEEPVKVDFTDDMDLTQKMQKYFEAKKDPKRRPPRPAVELPVIYGSVERTPLRQAVPVSGKVLIELHRDAK